MLQSRPKLLASKLVASAIVLAVVLGWPRQDAAQQPAAKAATATLPVPGSAPIVVGPTRVHHPWGRFQPGAWKLIRVVTENFDDASVNSLTETKTTLQSVDADGVTLLVEVAVQLGGKEFGSDPQTVRQGFHGETLSPGASIQPIGSGEVIIEGQRIPCQVFQLVTDAPAGKATTKIYYTAAVEPYVLRRETVRRTSANEITGETIAEVTALREPQRVLNRVLPTATVKTVHKDATGTTTTVAANSMEVPGGVVCYEATVADAQGRVIRRSTLELLDYGATPDDRQTGLFPRLRASRLFRVFRFPPHDGAALGP